MVAATELERQLDILRREVELEREIDRRRSARPLDHMDWLPGQLALLKSVSKRKQMRAGNQAQGKTHAGVSEVAFRAEGVHPFKVVPPPPTYQWVVCATDRQSGIVQRKFWEVVPRDIVAAGSRFDPRKGAFLGKYPKCMFTNGSWVEFRTGGGEATNLASESLHHVLIDEPPESERVFNELQKRLLRCNGDLTMTFTPVNRDVAWIKERASNGLIEDLHYRLTEANLTFVGSGQVMRLEDGSPMHQAWIDELIAETSDMEVPVVIHGEYEFRLEGAYFEKVWRESMVREAPGGDYEELIGIDLGDAPGKEIIMYIMVDETGGAKGHPHVHVEDMYVGTTGRESSEDDAEATVKMLKARGTSWAQLKSAKADRAHRAGTIDQKSSRDLELALASHFEIPLRKLKPRIRVAKRGTGRGAGSVAVRARWLHGQMSRGNFSVHPRCARLIDAIPKYSPFRDDEHKDPLDALVYGVDDYTFRRKRVVHTAVSAW